MQGECKRDEAAVKTAPPTNSSDGQATPVTSRDRTAAKPNERHIVYIQSDGPFRYYDVSAETVEGSGDEISGTGSGDG